MVGLKRGRMVLGLLVDALEGTYQSTVLAGAADAAAEADATLLCVAGGALSLKHPTARNAVYELVGQHNLDGLLVMTGALANIVGHEAIDHFIAPFRSMPICSIAAPIVGAINVLVDNERGMRDAMAHLVDESGCRQIAFIRGPTGNAEAQERFRVYREELQARGLDDSDALVVEGDFTQSAGAAAVLELFDRRNVRPDAIMAADDLIALGVLQALGDRSIRVPDEVAVMGFNDIEEARFASVPLTTVRQPLYEQGKHAVRAMMAALGGRPPAGPVVLPTELVKRRSTKGFEPSESSGVRVLSERRASGPDWAETFADAFASRRAGAIAEMEHALLVRAARSGNAWAAHLVDAFTQELAGESGVFVGAVRETVRASLDANAGSHGWQDVISILRREALPCLARDRDDRLRAENLWQVARLTIAELVERAQVHQRLQAEGWARSLGQTTGALISSFDLLSLVQAMAQQFPRLRIASCYLSLFDDADTSQAELLLAYDSRRPDLHLENRVRFLARELAPPEILPPERRAFVIQPLFFQEYRLGFAIFEYGPREGIIYEALRDQISASLKGAMLVAEVIEKDRERDLLIRDLEERARQLERAYKALQAGQRRLLVSETMASIGQMTARVRPLEELFGDVLAQLTGLLGGEDAFIAVVSSAPNATSPSMFPEPDGRPGLHLQAGVGRFATLDPRAVLTNAQQELVRGAYRSTCTATNAHGVAVPLQAGGEALGVLYLAREGTTDHELELLATFSTQATVAIQNAQLYQMAALDPLTEVHARRFFDQWLPREVQGAGTARRPLTVLMIDMDQMKRINDTGGHLAGDRALVTVGKVLREATRDHDVIARYGGDEFAVILPNTDASGAEVVGLRILDLARQQRIPVIDAPLRCSVGASTLLAPPPPATSVLPIPSDDLRAVAEGIVRRADEALYEAKSRGGACFAHREAVWLHPSTGLSGSTDSGKEPSGEIAQK